MTERVLGLTALSGQLPILLSQVIFNEINHKLRRI